MEFAKEAHQSISQVRKYTGEPYYLHAWEVALLVGRETDDQEVIAAAALHDVIEDVSELRIKFSPEAIQQEFGDTVLGIVLEMTHVFTHEKFPELNRRERKMREAERIKLTSEPARLIKIADNISNLKDVAIFDKDFAKVYAEELRMYFNSLPPCELKKWLARQLHSIGN